MKNEQNVSAPLTCETESPAVPLNDCATAPPRWAEVTGMLPLEFTDRWLELFFLDDGKVVVSERSVVAMLLDTAVPDDVRLFDFVVGALGPEAALTADPQDRYFTAHGAIVTVRSRDVHAPLPAVGLFWVIQAVRAWNPVTCTLPEDQLSTSRRAGMFGCEMMVSGGLYSLADPSGRQVIGTLDCAEQAVLTDKIRATRLD